MAPFVFILVCIYVGLTYPLKEKDITSLEDYKGYKVVGYSFVDSFNSDIPRPENPKEKDICFVVLQNRRSEVVNTYMYYRDIKNIKVELMNK